MAEMSAPKWEPTDYHFSDDAIVCPACGWRINDLTDFYTSRNRGVTECDDCGAEFSYEIDWTPNVTTRLIEQRPTAQESKDG